MVTFNVVLPTGTKFQMEIDGELGPETALEQDVDAEVLSGGGAWTYYRLVDGREVFVKAENEIVRASS